MKRPRGLALSRRTLLVGGAALAASGLAVGVYVWQRKRPVGPRAGEPEVNAWVVVQPDDTVVIRIAKSEMAQGSLTGLAQLVAEELDCDWTKVRTEAVEPAENIRRKWAWKTLGTGGSNAIRSSQQFLREAIALAEASVRSGGGPFGAVVVHNGEVVGRGNNRVVPNNDPTAHAEIVAIREACTLLNEYHLTGCTLCRPTVRPRAPWRASSTRRSRLSTR